MNKVENYKFKIKLTVHDFNLLQRIVFVTLQVVRELFLRNKFSAASVTIQFNRVPRKFVSGHSLRDSSEATNVANIVGIVGMLKKQLVDLKLNQFSKIKSVLP